MILRIYLIKLVLSLSTVSIVWNRYTYGNANGSHAVDGASASTSSRKYQAIGASEYQIQRGSFEVSAKTRWVIGFYGGSAQLFERDQISLRKEDTTCISESSSWKQMHRSRSVSLWTSGASRIWPHWVIQNACRHAALHIEPGSELDILISRGTAHDCGGRYM